MARTNKEIFSIADSDACNPDDRGWGPKFSVLLFGKAIESAATAPLLEQIAQLEQQLAEANKALHDAAISMHTISTLAGFHKTDAGNTFMGTFPDVRAYARSRSNVARESINAYYLQPHVKDAHEALRAAIAQVNAKGGEA